MQFIPSKLGEQVLLLRRRAGLSQAELAKQVGISRGTITKLESGRIQDLKFNAVCRLAEVLDVSMDALSTRPTYSARG